MERARMGLSMAWTPQTVKTQTIPQAVPSPISLLPPPPLPRRLQIAMSHKPQYVSAFMGPRTHQA